MNKLIPLLIIITLTFGAVTATGFPAPAGAPPTGNIVPLHTGVSQMKQGSLSVNTFIARGIAIFKQQIYINNTNLGAAAEGQKGHLKGSFSNQNNSGVVVFGAITDDAVYNTSLIGTDTITAKKLLQSGRVAHGIENTKRNLCADALGQVVYCEESVLEDIDVCANIQGTQTNPPIGMIQDGANCIWATVLPTPPPLSASTSGTTIAPWSNNGLVYDHMECTVGLNGPNNTGSALSFAINFQFTGNNGASSNSCDVTVGNGNTQSDPKQVYLSTENVRLTSWCYDMNATSQNVFIPNDKKC